MECTVKEELGLRNPFWKKDLPIIYFRYQSPREFLGPRSVSSPIPKKLRLRDPIELELGPDRLTHGYL